MRYGTCSNSAGQRRGSRHNPMHASHRMRRNASAEMRASAGFRPLRSERMVRFAQDQQRRQPVRCTALTVPQQRQQHTSSCAAYRSLSRPIVALRLCRQSTVPTVIRLRCSPEWYSAHRRQSTACVGQATYRMSQRTSASSVCIEANVCTCVCACTFACACARVDECLHARGCACLWASVCVRVHYMRACLCARMWVRVNVCRTGLCIHVCPVLQQCLDDLRWKATPSKYSRLTVDSHSTVTELGPVVQCTPVV